VTTNVQLIGDSLRLLGVIAETESPSAEQGAHALRVLNRMLEEWTERGINLGWFEQTSTTATAPLPAWAEAGVVSKLAQKLNATYPSAQLAPQVFDDSQNGYGTIARKCMVESMKPANMDTSPLGEGFRLRSRILTG
jgi:hypothetical protein